MRIKVSKARRQTLLLLILLFLFVGFPAGAQDVNTPTIAPLNPAFTQHLQQTAVLGIEGTTQSLTTGIIPPPLDLSHMKGKQVSTTRLLAGFPSSFDLRALGKLTPVKDQGYCGSCWSFATYGSMESCMLPTETRDFSENNLKNKHGFDPTCCAGGNHWMSTAYFARWDGPINEADDPYNASSCTSPTGLVVQKHVQAVNFIPDRGGPLDNDNIKQALMTYGAVYTCFYWDSGYYNPSTCAYYYNGYAYSNHAVCIVGWDDNYPASNFIIQPPGNGAFIVKNSWGTNWGSNGYLYISYYDTNIGTENALFITPQSTTNYKQVYQYDPLGWVSSLGYGNPTAWFANVFTATTSDYLAAVSFYVASPNSSYEIYVYLNPTSGPINPNGPVASKVGTIANAGYQTVVLNSPVQLTIGQKFSVVVKLTTPGYNWPIPFEYPFSGYSSAAEANPGESYISSNGTSWRDITTNYANANVCLKAFTIDGIGLSVSPASGMDSYGPVGGPFNPASTTYVLTNNSSLPINWVASKTQPWIDLSNSSGTLEPYESTNVEVSVNSYANSLTKGIYYDTITFSNTTNGVGNTTRNVTLTISNGNLWVSPTDALVSAGEPGGPFDPPSLTYTLTNIGYSSLNWTATKTQSWVALSEDSGTLEPGASIEVTVSIAPEAAQLPAGTYH
ncbi:MAG: lectin like domain-containing protein, partial [Armatimonadota bacterium]|nr:lectin like domain-containing protein [Armatimonadota bacterium]